MAVTYDGGKFTSSRYMEYPLSDQPIQKKTAFDKEGKSLYVLSDNKVM